MTEEHSEIHLCPVCGKENLPTATRCVYCGSEMDTLFTFSGQQSLPEEEFEESLPDIIEELRNDPSLQTPAGNEAEAETPANEQPDETALGQEQSPDWLSKVRERARGEDDSVGNLVSGINAMDAARSEEAAAGVEGEFNAWISRIREKNQQENSTKARQLPAEPEDPDEVPEWLRRIRALQPGSDEERTHEVRAGDAPSDDLPHEWTDEALMELRRQALAEDAEQATEPLPADNLAAEVDEPANPVVSEGAPETIQAEPELAEDHFHNIPEDELEDSAPDVEPESHEAPAEEDVTNPEEPVEAEQVLPLVEPQDEIAQDGPQENEPQPEAAETAEPAEPASENQPGDTPDQSERELPASEDGTELPSGSVEEDLKDLDQPADSSAVLQDLLLLRDQQNRAKLLASLIEQEGRITAGSQASRRSASNGGRLAVALLLLIALIVSILIGPESVSQELPKSVPAIALQDKIAALTSADTVLVVLDYQAAASSELEALAAPLLAQLHSQGTQLIFLTTQPSGLFLGQALIAAAGLPEDTQVEYLPGSYLSLISWAMDPEISPDLNPVKAESLLQVSSLDAFTLILVVSDSAESIRGWLEQIAPWLEPSTFAAVTTQMEAPVLSPYYDSGQLIGYASALTDGNLDAAVSFNYRAYRVGLLLMLVMLVLGTISKVDEDANRKEQERSE